MSETLGMKVRRLRIDMGHSQEDIAAAMRGLAHRFGEDLLRVDQSEVSRIERGVKHAQPHELAALAVVLGVSTDYLLGLADETGDSGK